MIVKPRVVLFDVDGTLMKNTGGRSFYDWHRVGEDTPNAAVVELFAAGLVWLLRVLASMGWPSPWQ